MPDVESLHSLEEAYQAILSAPSFDAWIKTTPFEIRQQSIVARSPFCSSS